MRTQSCLHLRVILLWKVRGRRVKAKYLGHGSVNVRIISYTSSVNGLTMTRVNISLYLYFRATICRARYQGYPIGVFFMPIAPTRQGLLTRYHLIGLSRASAIYLGVRRLVPGNGYSLVNTFLWKGILAQREPIWGHGQANRRALRQLLYRTLYVGKPIRNRQLFTKCVPPSS